MKFNFTPCNSTCFSVPGVILMAYNIHSGAKSVDERVKNAPIA